MFARVEVAMKPEYADPAADAFLRKLQLAHPDLRSKVRWARMIDTYLLDLPLPREEMIAAITEVFWDPVLHWVFTGGLIPSVAGKQGGLNDLMDASPNRPGKFWCIEKKYRGGVTDNVGRTTLEAFEIVRGESLPEGRASSGAMILLEGPDLNEDLLAVIARDVFCNELIEAWNLLLEPEMKKIDRFNQERVKREIPRVHLRSDKKTADQVETIRLHGLTDEQLVELSKSSLWALSLEEMHAIREHFNDPKQQGRRRLYGLNDPTDVEMEVIAQTWSEHCKHKIFGGKFDYVDTSGEDRGIPSVVDGLFRTTIAGTTAELPKPWLLSVFEDNAGIVAFDEKDAFCIKVETHNSPSALDPYGGALTGIVGVNRDILGCGLGAKPIFNTNVFCLAEPDYAKPLPERLLHPRRILDGVRRGVEHGGNKSGIPTINGALCFDDRYLGKPLVYCGTGGFMPRQSAGRPCELKEVKPGDRICMVGGRIGKDGIHGATFSSLALDESSPATAVQLGDPITQKRMADFLLEARDLGLYRGITDNGAGGLSSSVGEMARLSGGARMDVSKAKTKYPGLKPFELVVSESQERMTVAVPPEKMDLFLELAERRSVEVSDLGYFTDLGSFDIFYGDVAVASLDLEFLHKGAPRLEIRAEWSGRPSPKPSDWDLSFSKDGGQMLTSLLGRPNIASKEWMIRQYDHEVQGTSVIKPLHTAGLLSGGPEISFSGPNDAGVVRPRPGSAMGITVGCGLNPKLSDVDAYLMAQSSVDEAVRNVISVGAEYGTPESVMALVDNFCWPDPLKDPAKAAALVRACFGLRDAALALGLPLVSGKDSMKNDYRGRLDGREIHISVPPTLLITAVARVKDVRNARTSDFKGAGDAIYLLGGKQFGLLGSELQSMTGKLPGQARSGEPDWELARRVYSWLGGATGCEQERLRSLHDVSEGGVAVAVAEGLLARGFGATIEVESGSAGEDPWEFCFGEGFHSFVTTIESLSCQHMENEWAQNGVPFLRIGTVSPAPALTFRWKGPEGTSQWSVLVERLRSAWRKEGYWE